MPETARRRPAEERRAQILDAAQRCFGAKGYHAATMDDLVRASGLSKGSLYWHFRSKEEVFLGLFDRYTREIFDAWSQSGAAGAGVLAGIRAGAELLLRRLSGESELLGSWAEFLSHPAARERYAEVLRASREQLAALLGEGVARGEVRDLPVDGMAAALVSAMEGMLLQVMVDPGFDAEPHWEVLWSGLTGGYAR
jgi:AcrR family transcriptional regulator